MMRTLLAPIALGLSLAACGTSQQSSLNAVPAPATFTYDFTDGVTAPQKIFFSDYGKDDVIEAKKAPGYSEKVEKFVAEHNRQPDAFEIGNLVLGSGNLYLSSEARSLVSTPEVKGIVLTHINRTDDVDTNIVIELGAEQGIKVGGTYEISGEVEFYSNTPTGGFGIGGAPDAVKYGLSVSDYEWDALLTDKAPYYYRTITNKKWSVNPFGDKNYAAMGAVNNGITDGEEGSHDFALQSLNTERSIKFATKTGKIYANFRTHSGFEGYSIWAVKSVKVTIKTVK